MCGFGIGTIFQVAIFVIVVLVVLALLRALLGDFFASITSAPYWNIIQIVIGGVVAILILLFLWRLAECAGLFGAGWAGVVGAWHDRLSATSRPRSPSTPIARTGRMRSSPASSARASRSSTPSCASTG